MYLALIYMLGLLPNMVKENFYQFSLTATFTQYRVMYVELVLLHLNYTHTHNYTLFYTLNCRKDYENFG